MLPLISVKSDMINERAIFPVIIDFTKHLVT